MREKSSGKILVVGDGGERKDTNGKPSRGNREIQESLRIGPQEHAFLHP